MTGLHTFSVRSLTEPHELYAVMALQRLACGEDPAWHISLPSLVSYARNGGQVLGAFDGELLVGFLVAFLGTDTRDPRRPAMANLKLVMERIVVHPDYRGVGLATQMARRLRELATMQGIRLVTSAFDPLSSRDAYLYIRKLGAVVQHYAPDYYGIAMGDSPTPVSVDVVIGEWWLTRNRAEERLLGKRNSLTLSQYLDANTPIINPSWARSNGMQAEPHTGPLQGEAGVLLLVEVPADYSVMLHTDKNLASAWRQHSREVFREVLEQGYVATDFLHEPYQGRDRSFYLMSYDGPRSGAEV